MSEQEHKPELHLEMMDARREQIQTWFEKCEDAAGIPLVDEAEMQAAVETLWHWFFGMRRDVVGYVNRVKYTCQRTNELSNGVFDWRDGAHGELLVERLERLRLFQYSIGSLTAVFDDIRAEGAIRDWITIAPDPDYTVSYLPPLAHTFYRPLLKTLQLMHGGGKAKTVLRTMREIAGSQTDDADYLNIATPRITVQQWRSVAYRAAAQMDKKGLLIRERGEWVITRKGETFLEENE